MEEERERGGEEKRAKNNSDVLCASTNSPFPQDLKKFFFLLVLPNF